MTASTAASRSGAAHLTTSDLERLRRELTASAEDHRRQLEELRSTADSLMGQTDSDSLLERELAERSAAHAVEALAEIDHALARLDDGTYGTCEGCGAPIALARLEAIPHTPVCVSCPPGERRTPR
jgi:DnaK suppressor protein